jgi:hypothetical protein
MKNYIKLIKEFTKLNSSDASTVAVMSSFEKYVVNQQQIKNSAKVKSDHAKFQSAFWSWVKQNQHIPELVKSKDNNLLKLFCDTWAQNTSKVEGKTVPNPVILHFIQMHELNNSFKDFNIHEIVKPVKADKAPIQEPSLQNVEPKPEQPKPETTTQEVKTEKVKIQRKKKEVVAPTEPAPKVESSPKVEQKPEQAPKTEPEPKTEVKAVKVKQKRVL